MGVLISFNFFSVSFLKLCLGLPSNLGRPGPGMISSGLSWQEVEWGDHVDKMDWTIYAVLSNNYYRSLLDIFPLILLQPQHSILKEINSYRPHYI